MKKRVANGTVQKANTLKSKIMRFLFPLESNPVAWAEWLVGSWTKFLIWGLLYSCLACSVVIKAASSDPGRHVYGTFLLIFFYLTLLYGLRRLYMTVRAGEK